MNDRSAHELDYQTHIRELAAAYAVGALDDAAERTYFEDLLIGKDAEAIQQLAAMFETSAGLATMVPQVDALHETLSSLLKKVHHVPKDPSQIHPLAHHKAAPLEQKTTAPKSERAYVPVKTKPWVIGGGAFLLILIIGLTVRLLNLRGPDRETIAALEQTQAERDSLQKIVATQQKLDSLMQVARAQFQDPAVVEVAMMRPGDSIVASRMYWSPARKRLLWFGSEIIDVTPGLHLHVWQVVGGRKIDLGSPPHTIDTIKGNYEFLPPSPQATGFEVTGQAGSDPSNPHQTLLVGNVAAATSKK